MLRDYSFSNQLYRNLAARVPSSPFWRGCWDGWGCTLGVCLPATHDLPHCSKQMGGQGAKIPHCDSSFCLFLARARMPVILLLISCVPVATQSSQPHNSTSQQHGRWQLTIKLSVILPFFKKYSPEVPLAVPVFRFC